MATTHPTMALCLLAALVMPNALPVGAAQTGSPAVSGMTMESADDGRIQAPLGRLAVQVGAFKKRHRAEKETLRLATKGYTSFYCYEDTGTKGMWYRVYAGSYATQQEAREAAGRLRRLGIVAWHMVRKFDAEGTVHFAGGDQKSERSPAGPQPNRERSAFNIVAVGEQPLKPKTTPLEMASESSRLPASDVAGPGAEAAPQPRPESTRLRLSLLDAFCYSMEGNREIQVASYTPRQSREDILSAEAVYDPFLFADASYRRDPNLDSSVTDIVTEDEGLAQTGIRQPLKTGGSISTYLETRYSDLKNAQFDREYSQVFAPTVALKQPLLNNLGSKKEQTAIKIANFKANISEEELRAKVIDVTNRVARVYWKLYLSRELIAINRENVEMAEEIYRRESERLNRGISQPLDVERARTNLQSRRSTLLKSEEEYRIAMDRLKLLLNWGDFKIDTEVEVVPIETPLTTPLLVDEAEAIQTALQYRPEILKTKQERMIREADVELASHQRLPKLDAFGRYSVSGYGDGFSDATDDLSVNDEDSWEFGINFKWAIGNRAADSRYRKKRLRQKQIEAQLGRIEDDIKLEVKQILHGITTARREIETSRLAKEAAHKVVEGEFARFDIGQTTNEELLRAQDLLALTSRNYTRAVVNYNIALHDLAASQGVLPDGITIK